MAGFPAFWLERGIASASLLPIAALYGAVCQRRRRYLTARARPLDVPVLIVGNIFVGGTGKTPLVHWLIEELRRRGHRPGIVSRGYGGQAREWPQYVQADSDPHLVGDEPVLLAQRTAQPVMVAPDRVTAAQRLIDEHGCDVIVADDGLQHYRLHRDAEIIVVDAARQLGNARLLPAGPLREPRTRLDEVDLVIANGGACAVTPYGFKLTPLDAVNLLTGARRSLTVRDFPVGVRAVAGIGNPRRFFDMLEERGLDIRSRAFPDHHRFTAADLSWGAADQPLLMTEKDAVKCRSFATTDHWYVPVAAELSESAVKRFNELLDGVLGGR